MTTEALNKQNIFAIPVGGQWGAEEDRVQLLYAPLNGNISLATRTDVEELEACAATPSESNAGKRQLLSSFQAAGKVPVYRIPKTPHELYQIDILANHTCNFHCIYCYSAAGRSAAKLTFAQVKPLIDYLFCSGKTQKTPYIINFSGGGEPLLSFDLIRQTVEYIEEVNRGKSYKYDIGIVTNGSLITPQIIDFLQEKQVNMAVSFEILKRLQDKERGSYDLVAQNIDLMLARDYPFGIRTTFTPESVGMMGEMIDEVHRRFPKLKKVVFDVVLAPDLFPTPESLADYYDTFLDGFYRAKQKASDYGIILESIAVEMLSIVRDRTCEGKIVLTPTGAVSSCARVSSPKEPLFDQYVYGEVADDCLTFDQKRFEKILGESNIFSEPRCASCFAKWNCGGGCRLFHHSFEEAYEEVRCDFVRKALKRQLIGTLKKNFNQSTGQELDAFMEEKIKNGDL